jgi:predicted amidophosphoribosyltransferase
MSVRRLVLNGENHAAVLATHVGRMLDIEVDYEVCRRTRHTPRQTRGGRRERLRNLAGAFACIGSIDGARVGLVDDVMTTGATARAIGRVLLARGAAEVHVWVAARTERVTAR